MRYIPMFAIALALALTGAKCTMGDTQNGAVKTEAPKVNESLLCKGTDAATCEADAGCKWNHTKKVCKVDRGENVIPAAPVVN